MFTANRATDILLRTGFPRMPSIHARTSLALLLAPVMLFARPATDDNQPTTAHPVAAKAPAPRRAKAAVPPQSVEVFNGASIETQEFNAPEPSAAIPAGTNHSPAVTTVEIINGSDREIKTLNQTPYETNRQGSAPHSAQPVVVAIVSSDTKRVGVNKQTVVVGIAPRPKRPPYQP
jgi:hypothetical protein